MYVHGAFVHKNFTVTHITSLHFKTNSLTHKSRQFTPHHFTYLHSVPTCSPLLVTTFLTLFLNVFSLHGKAASKPAGTWFQLLMVRFTKEYLSTSVICFLVLIFGYLGYDGGFLTNPLQFTSDHSLCHSPVCSVLSW